MIRHVGGDVGANQRFDISLHAADTFELLQDIGVGVFVELQTDAVGCALVIAFFRAFFLSISIAFPSEMR